jgi:hypothetical protein
MNVSNHHTHPVRVKIGPAMIENLADRASKSDLAPEKPLS